MREQRLEVQRLVEVVSQHFQIQHFGFKVCGICPLKCLNDGKEHVFS
jgi:hypothetical protein